MRKLTILFVALTLSAGMWAETETVSYLYPVYNDPQDVTKGIQKWETKTADATEITNAAGSLNEGWYVVKGTDVQTGTLTCQGAVHIILADGAKLTATGLATYAGIQVSNGASLTIYAQSTGTQMGKLIATGGNMAAGIGGELKGDGSNITINGGTVTATGGGEAAGIGGGKDGSGTNITINGGVVTAQGGNRGAGIGGGVTGEGSNITINGGKVTATGGSYSLPGTGSSSSLVQGAAGIGGGYSGFDITINGGEVTATGGLNSAGIGGGGSNKGSNITIKGGRVIATGGNYGAGIGGGNEGDGSNITITGGEVTAIGGVNAAGIGGGNNKKGSYITIKDGIVTAQGGNGGAGIGGGDQSNGSNITIHGGTVTATGGDEAAGIGGGKWSNGSNIIINGGTVTATGGVQGAGIGGGDLGKGFDITINGGKVIATGGYYLSCFAEGIGSGCSGDGSCNIKVAINLIIKADNNNPPSTGITNNGGDLASSLKEKIYVKIEVNLTPIKNAAIAAIDAAINGVTDEGILAIANKAKEDINAATTEEDVNSIKNKAMADIEAAAINLPQTKVAAIAEIDAAVKDVIDADVLAIANKAKEDIDKAITVEKVNTIKTQALADLAIFIKIYNSGKAAALGAMGEECTGCTAVEVTDGTTTVKLYNATGVDYIKVSSEE